MGKVEEENLWRGVTKKKNVIEIKLEKRVIEVTTKKQEWKMQVSQVEVVKSIVKT